MFTFCGGDSGLGCLFHCSAHLVGAGEGGQARILLAAWSRAFKAYGPNSKGTQLSSKWTPSIVGKNKGRLLRRALAMFACLLSSYLARRGARGWESQTRIWFTEWTEVPQFLNCGMERRKELSGVLHIRSWEFTTLFFMNLWSSVFLQSQCKIQTTFMLVIIMTRPWVKIKSTFGSISVMIWTHCYFGIIVVNRLVARSCYFVHIEKVHIMVKYFQ